jgi:hypothetical protein
VCRRGLTGMSLELSPTAKKRPSFGLPDSPASDGQFVGQTAKRKAALVFERDLAGEYHLPELLIGTIAGDWKALVRAELGSSELQLRCIPT